jgi:hypothetical protein
MPAFDGRTGHSPGWPTVSGVAAFVFCPLAYTHDVVLLSRRMKARVEHSGSVSLAESNPASNQRPRDVDFLPMAEH